MPFCAGSARRLPMTRSRRSLGFAGNSAIFASGIVDTSWFVWTAASGRIKTVGLVAFFLAVAWGEGLSGASAQPPGPISNSITGSDLVPLPTLGGKQFWADELFFHRWRLQRSVLTGHCRLLDEHNRRHAYGTYVQCRAKLEQIKRLRNLPPMQGKAVIVLHGLFRSRSSMSTLCKRLESDGQFVVFNVGYPSTRRNVAGHAAALGRVVENLHGIDEINFVAHSLGNIVIRHYLADQSDEAAGRSPDPRIKRFVMLGPPNHGSLAALAASENSLFTTMAGSPGQQLGPKWGNLKGKLATPAFEFGIIAGGTGNRQGFNPLLAEDNDGIVTVASTRLAGATDFVVVPTIHSLIMTDPKVIEYTLRFLQKGYFVSANQRRPLRAADE